MLRVTVIRYLSLPKLRHIYEKRQGALAKCVDFSMAKVKRLQEQGEGSSSNEVRKDLKKELTTVSACNPTQVWMLIPCTIVKHFAYTSHSPYII